MLTQIYVDKYVAVFTTHCTPITAFQKKACFSPKEICMYFTHNIWEK